MGYMKGLNEWLERDVRNRREEFKDVFQTVEALRRQIRGMRKRKGRGDRERERNRREESSRRRPRSRTRSGRPETTIRLDRILSTGPPAPTTPVAVTPQFAAPRPQRWTAVPALIQALPANLRQQQRIVVPPVVPGNPSRPQGSSRMSYVPARAQPQLQPQPTIILLPAGTRAPANPNLHPVDWQYSGGRNGRLERNGTSRSRR